MLDIHNKLITFLVSSTLLGVACDSEPAPGSEQDGGWTRLHAVEAPSHPAQTDVVVDETDMDPIDAAVQLRIGTLPDGSLGLIEGARGRSIAPGVWEVEAEDGLRQQIALGDEGQRWLIAQMTAELDGLHGDVDLDDALLGQIAAMEEGIAAAELDRLSAAPDGVPGLSCNVGLYAGPSGPVSGIPGAAALAQSSCTGGCTSITVRSQACCNGACTPLSISTNNAVCASPWTAGVIRQGSGVGWAQVYVAPVAVTNQGFACN